MKGKDKCKILKEIRRQIAAENDIAWTVSECQHKGECRGTCPKCESEVRQLERELSLRQKLGKGVAIVGISAACVTGLTACSLEEVVEFGQELVEGVTDYLKGTCRKEPATEYPTYEVEGEIPAEGYIDDEELILDGDVEINYDEEPGYIEMYYEEEFELPGEPTAFEEARKPKLPAF